MRADDQPTIFALSTAPGQAAIAVIRLSGPAVRFVLETMAGACPAPGTARVASIRGRNGLYLDRGLVLFFAGPRSFTGEDCGELHVHGSRAVVQAVLAELGGLPGLEPADRGAFTRRAFEHGKMDLVAVEGLADLVSAETEQQRLQALGQATGAASRLYAAWSDTLLRARAWIEAGFDFTDEADIPDAIEARAEDQLAALRAEMQMHLAASRGAEIVREGFRVVLSGAPNVGKSSLLNALAQRDIAIVSDEAGTTRDIVQVRMEIDGHSVIVQDTAGVREAESAVEREGVRRALAAARMADLVLHLTDLTAATPSPLAFEGRRVLRVGTKADLLVEEQRDQGFDCRLSARTGAGIADLLGAIGCHAAEASSRPAVGPVRARQVAEVRAAVTAIDAFLERPDRPLELRAEDLRAAQLALDRLVGRRDIEDLLGVIFSEFCVGK